MLARTNQAEDGGDLPSSGPGASVHTQHAERHAHGASAAPAGPEKAEKWAVAQFRETPALLPKMVAITLLRASARSHRAHRNCAPRTPGRSHFPRWTTFCLWNVGLSQSTCFTLQSLSPEFLPACSQGPSLGGVCPRGAPEAWDGTSLLSPISCNTLALSRGHVPPHLPHTMTHLSTVLLLDI